MSASGHHIPTMTVWFEPAIDSMVRRHCQESKTSIGDFVRKAVADLCEDNSIQRSDIPTQQDIYGKLSFQGVTLRFPKHERRAMEKLAERLKINRKRSFSRIIRYAVNRACSRISFSDG